MMMVAALMVKVSMAGNVSLKDKRRVVKSLVGKVRARFNASAADVGDQDSLTTAELGFTVCGRDRLSLSLSVESISQFVVDHVGAEVTALRSFCPVSCDEFEDEESDETVENLFLSATDDDANDADGHSEDDDVGQD
jgi:uncharacterized protein YlxP (DUF503 family)